MILNKVKKSRRRFIPSLRKKKEEPSPVLKELNKPSKESILTRTPIPSPESRSSTKRRFPKLRREKATSEPKVCKTRRCKTELDNEWKFDICPECTIKAAQEKIEKDKPPPRVCVSKRCKKELAEDWDSDICPDCMKKKLVDTGHIDLERATVKPAEEKTKYATLAPVDLGYRPSDNTVKRVGAVCIAVIVLLAGVGVVINFGGVLSPYVPPTVNPTDYDWHGMTITGWYTIEAWVTDGSGITTAVTAMQLFHEYSWDNFQLVEEHGFDKMGQTHQFNPIPLGAVCSIRFSTEWGSWSLYSQTFTVEIEGEQKNFEWESKGQVLHVAINRG